MHRWLEVTESNDTLIVKLDVVPCRRWLVAPRVATIDVGADVMTACRDWRDVAVGLIGSSTCWLASAGTVRWLCWLSRTRRCGWRW